MSADDKIMHVARYAEASYLAEVFEVLFRERCRHAGIDPHAMAPGESPIFFLLAAEAGSRLSQ